MPITISITGEIAEIRQYLQALLPEAPETATSGGSPWNLDDAYDLYQAIRPDARRMIDALMESPEGLSWEAWQRRVGLEGVKFGGARSSIGHNSRSFPDHPEVVTWVHDRYRLDASFARSLSDALALVDEATKLGFNVDDFETWAEVQEEIERRRSDP